MKKQFPFIFFVILTFIQSMQVAKADAIQFMDAPLSAVLATFSSITGDVYIDELQSKETVTFITNDDVTDTNAELLLNSIIAPLGGVLDKIDDQSYRIVSVNRVGQNSDKTSATAPVKLQKPSEIKTIKAPPSIVERVNLYGKMDRRGLETLISLDDRLKSVGVVNDGVSNDSVILVGSKSQIENIKTMLQGLATTHSKAPAENIKTAPAVASQTSLFAPTTQPEMMSKVIDMRFSTAATIATSLEPVLSQSGLSDSGSLAAHSESNQIILIGKPTWIELVDVLVQQMDREPRQVYVDAIIAEISESSTRKLGLQFSGRGGVLGGAISSSTSGANIGSVANNTLLAGLNGGLIAIGGGASALPDLGLLLNAIESDSDNRILATPSLMTLENRESEILVGQNVPFITGQIPANNNSQSSTPFQTIQREDLGISLTLRPVIGMNNDLILEIKQGVSGLDSTASGLSDVATKKREISTVIRTRPGETIAIGGLRDTKTEQISSKVPILGDIPAIGALFRQESVRTVNTNLVIFLRPTLTTTSSARIRMFEQKQQILNDRQVNANLSADAKYNTIDLTKLVDEVDAQGATRRDQESKQ